MFAPRESGITQLIEMVLLGTRHGQINNGDPMTTPLSITRSVTNRTSKNTSAPEMSIAKVALRCFYSFSLVRIPPAVY